MQVSNSKLYICSGSDLPVFAFYFLLSFNKAAAPNWDALAFVSFGLLAIGYWREKLERQLGLQRLFAVGIYHRHRI